MASYSRIVKVTPQIFDSVKLLTKCGSSSAEIANYLRISVATVRNINRVDSYADFRNECAKRALEAKRKNEHPEPKPEPVVIPDLKQTGGTISGAYQMNRMYELMKQQTELLAGISRKLAFIVEELGGGADDASGKNQEVS